MRNVAVLTLGILVLLSLREGALSVSTFGFTCPSDCRSAQAAILTHT